VVVGGIGHRGLEVLVPEVLGGLDPIGPLAVVATGVRLGATGSQEVRAKVLVQARVLVASMAPLTAQEVTVPPFAEAAEDFPRISIMKGVAALNAGHQGPTAALVAVLVATCPLAAPEDLCPRGTTPVLGKAVLAAEWDHPVSLALAEALGAGTTYKVQATSLA